MPNYAKIFVAGFAGYSRIASPDRFSKWIPASEIQPAKYNSFKNCEYCLVNRDALIRDCPHSIHEQKRLLVDGSFNGDYSFTNTYHSTLERCAIWYYSQSAPSNSTIPGFCTLEIYYILPEGSEPNLFSE